MTKEFRVVIQRFLTTRVPTFRDRMTTGIYIYNERKRVVRGK